ncbi:MAG: hypothetical protein U1F77_02135 [Kiritimatiellia bacterium]
MGRTQIAFFPAFCPGSFRVMRLAMHFFPHELGFYSVPTWLAFGVIALGVARLFPPWCIPIGHLVVAAGIFWLDCAWVSEEMRQPEWDGAPDFDAVFAVGVLLRILLVNTVLLPLTLLGVLLRRRRFRRPESPPQP